MSIHNWIQVRFADGLNFVTDASDEVAAAIGTAIEARPAAVGCQVGSVDILTVRGRRTCFFLCLRGEDVTYAHALVPQAGSDVPDLDDVCKLLRQRYGVVPEDRVGQLVRRLALVSVADASAAVRDLFISEAECVEVRRAPPVPDPPARFARIPRVAAGIARRLRARAPSLRDALSARLAAWRTHLDALAQSGRTRMDANLPAALTTPIRTPRLRTFGAGRGRVGLGARLTVPTPALAIVLAFTISMGFATGRAAGSMLVAAPIPSLLRSQPPSAPPLRAADLGPAGISLRAQLEHERRRHRSLQAAKDRELAAALAALREAR